MDKIPLLIETLPYMKKFKGTTFVIKLSGSVVKEPDALVAIATDLSVLHSLGIKLIIVHGGGPQADEILRRLHHPIRKIDGRRVTDRQTLEVAKMTYAGKINTEIVAALQASGLSAVGLSGIDGNTVQAQKRKAVRVKDLKTGKTIEIDYGHVGDITEVDPQLIKLLVERDYIPVVASFGIDSSGKILNINADTIATEIAVAVKAEKLINISNVPGILDDPSDRSTTISFLNIELARKLLKTGKVNGGMLPKLTSCISSIEGGVPRAHIIDGTAPHSILFEIFTNQGCGTMIVNKKEEAKYLKKNGNK